MKPPDNNTSPTPELAAVVRLVEERCGVVVPASREALLGAQLQRAGDGQPATHVAQQILAGDELLWTRLLRELAIPETYLFRHPGHYAVLHEQATELRRQGRACRVLSAGTSTGEEAWSAAAVVASVYLPSCSDFEVTGWDLNSDNVRAAQAGRYGSWSARAGLGAYRSWFQQGADELVVIERLRPFVSFETRNLIALDWPADTRYDAIFFRNVSIYWRMETAQAVVERLTECLAEDGYLCCGPSDPMLLDRDRWHWWSRDDAPVFQRGRVAPAARALPPRPAKPTRSARRASPKPPPKTAKPARRRPAAAPQRPASAPPEVSAPPAPPDPLERIQQLADAGQYREALELLPDSPEGLSPPQAAWRGILHLNLDEAEIAVGMFRQCVYLAPEDPAYRRWLALALETVGRDEEAEREYRNARMLEDAEPSL